MSNFLEIHPSQLQGHFTVPSSKSHTLRAILLASLASGKSVVSNWLNSTDTHRMIKACESFGAKIEVGEFLSIEGNRGVITTPGDVIDVGNSGLVLRLCGAIAALGNDYTVFSGDESIRSRRPVQPLIDGVNGWGGFAASTKRDGHAPLIVKGPFVKGEAFIDGEDSQPVSALLLAGALSSGKKVLHVKNPGELPWIGLTLDWMKNLGLTVTHQNYKKYEIKGGESIDAFSYQVPGDFSSAAFPLAAGIVTNSTTSLSTLDMQDAQGDKQLFLLLEKLGVNLSYNKEGKTFFLGEESSLPGAVIDVSCFIDALPILAVLGCYAKSPWRIYNAKIARKKESDRIHSICTELKKMGANIQEKESEILVFPSKLKGACLNSWHDHRIAMALIVAALGAEGASSLEAVECIKKTYPYFVEDMKQAGANIEFKSEEPIDNTLRI
jgi:3-phosphoshikimate 1-carboxyvinyltransferase